MRSNKGMDLCNSKWKVYDKDNSFVANKHVTHENQQSIQPSCIKCEFVAEKSELEKILKTVSLLCPSNPVETSGSSNDDKCKKDKPNYIDDDDDDDEITIVDVIISRDHKKKKMSSNTKLDNPSSANKSLEKNSESRENVIDLADIQEVQITNENSISENITDSVDIQVAQNMNANVISENIANSVEIQVSQNIHSNDISKNIAHSDALDQNIDENYICKNVEIVPEDVLKNDLCGVSAIECEDNTSVPKLDLISVSSTIDGSDLRSSCSENCAAKYSVDDIVEISEHETTVDNAMCDEIMDVTDDPNEPCSYEIEYDFSPGPPPQITGSWNEFSAGKKNNFTRGCKWAPDGSCIVTCSNDNKLRIFNLPPQLWDSSQWSKISEMEAVLKISEGDLIYDYCWYPLMNSNDPATCCLASTSRKSTVHLWDAYSGELRCSYRSFNHLDELVTPHSLSFDSDGERLFCGFHNVVRIFDVNRPGRIFEERQVYDCKTGQCGIISCFAFSSANKSISAAGSYQKSIGLYSEPYGDFLCLLEGQANGITQIQFSPDGNYLYSGGRKDPEILCWDIRNYAKVVFSLRRSCDTNQRMYFDISRCGKYVVSGNQNGVITFWDVTTEPKIIEKSSYPVLVPTKFYLAHDDCVNGVSFHPSHPLLCSSSGQRKFPVLLDDDSEDIFSYDIKQDNSLRLWWIGKLD